MNQSVVKQENNEVTIKIELDAKEFGEGLQHSYIKNKGRYNLPGFRKGKAPRGVIERYYGEGIFFEDAANKLISEKYPEALDALELSPSSKPEIEIEEIGEKEGLVFTAVFAVTPEFELGDYSALEIEAVDREVSEEKIDSRIEEEREKNGRITVLDRAAKKGDVVNLDFEGSIDGEIFEGGSMKAHDLKLGSGSFIPGFEEQLEGHSAGDEVSVNVKFPEDYRAEHLAGKNAVFACKINEVKELVLPELNDEFVKDVSEFDTLEEYRNHVREELAKEIEKSSEELKKQRVFAAAAALMTEELPERMIETEIDSMVEHLSNQLKRQGLSAEQYFEFLGGESNLRKDMRNDAIQKIKQDLVFDKILKKENFEVTEEDKEKEYQRMADLYKMSVDTVRSFYEGQQRALNEQIQFDKVVSMLMNGAVEK